MMMTRIPRLLLSLAPLTSFTLFAADLPGSREPVAACIDREFPSLEGLYKHLHAHPEISFQEEKTAARIAAELRGAGFEVTEKVGGHGIVGVLKNGSGPVILVRTDLDALPVREETGLPWASQARATDDTGAVVDVMHACGHDVHMTVFAGTARVLASLRERWKGTLVFMGQPAEERGAGARKMLADGLFTRFPKPRACIALHVSAALPVGMIGWTEGFALANVDSVDITFRGTGGHGAWPHTTRDPIVLAAQAILSFQTIVSRETEPGNAAVVTVGSIHGGTKHNIIPDEVKLQLTLRSYTEAVRQNTIASIRRISKGLAEAAGVPADRSPIVALADGFTPALYNDPVLMRRVVGSIEGWLGAERVRAVKPVMGGEDFGELGRTPDKVPVSMLWLGAVELKRVEESERTGKPLPSLHSNRFVPVHEPAIRTGITAMCAAVLGLLD
ncbi:MAG TPA: amidohydrolase [Planctomycetota bacterium]|nr:amidohydrolase [Planctomycetota bacterium]